MHKSEISISRERVLDVAEQLFSEHGYSAVTLRTISTQLQMKVASLYYHFPQGKEELFMAVIERAMQRHQSELNRIIEEKGDDWQGQLYGVAHWLLSQPTLDTTRLVRSDLREISKSHADEIMMHLYLMIQPVEGIFVTAHTQTGKQMPHPGVLAGVFLSIINGLNISPMSGNNALKIQSADAILQVLIKGLLAE